MQKIAVGLFALAASLSLSAGTLIARDYDKGGDGGGSGASMHHDSGGGGGDRMRHDSGGGGATMHRDHDGGGGVVVRHGDRDGGRHHGRHGHWRGGIWIYDDYDGGYGGGYCYRWRHACADRWGWRGPGFYRCVRRHGC